MLDLFFSASACSVIRHILHKQTKFVFFFLASDRKVLFGKENSIDFF
jgi:hypothetical protein